MAAVMNAFVGMCVAFLLMSGWLWAEGKAECVQVSGVDVCISDGSVRYGENQDRLEAAFSEGAVFAVDASGTPQVVRTGKGSVVAVVDSSAVHGSGECKTTVRGILVTPAGKVRLCPKVQNVWSCSRGPWDEKMFIVIGNSALEK
ncbi:hypothetical protein SAMN05421830_12050 [Desulfomicrobium norvegicum]|uniref:Uncharacterized protein n=1 Tax=Desulfomicrobium norvegicum (strain DSM 1741 / NCIMB 8310) TaxID=52561 RepID=A0A8G2F7G4_DESNO|nr:hypothetical protein SAMN05421830_12050 [Desulfomicrobium norvegicum]